MTFALRKIGKASYRRSDGLVILPWPVTGVSELDISDEIVKAVHHTFNRSLTPKEVRSILGITNTERLMWMKDGRLPPSGRVFLRGSQLTSVQTYSVKMVQNLYDTKGK